MGIQSETELEMRMEESLAARDGAKHTRTLEHMVYIEKSIVNLINFRVFDIFVKYRDMTWTSIHNTSEGDVWDFEHDKTPGIHGP
ncbi:hypothetical protein QYF36_009339 [Acer negundo]|nr:hypothetical protein QYF36_009339 [Acer negundo]